jgi:hypothetical protein
LINIIKTNYWKERERKQHGEFGNIFKNLNGNTIKISK